MGRDAEARAAALVQESGFTVLWRNVRIGPLEIDLVARRDDLAIVVEVRGRGAGAYERPLSSVTWNKRRMLLRAARGVWRGRLKKMQDIRRMRIDVIAIAYADEGPPFVEWIAGAITEEG